MNPNPPFFSRGLPPPHGQLEIFLGLRGQETWLQKRSQSFLLCGWPLDVTSGTADPREGGGLSKPRNQDICLQDRSQRAGSRLPRLATRCH